MSSHADSKRTSVSHEKSIQRRVSTHEKNLSQYLADRAFARFCREHNAKVGA